MATFKLKTNNYDPHPEGIYTGTITEVRDVGEKDTQYGPKHRIAIIIENQDLSRDDGQPWQHFEFCNLASGQNARLTTLRQKLFKRPLTSVEIGSFDADGEMVGKQVRYQIEHGYGENRTFANLVTWSLLEASDEEIATSETADSETLPF